jgi:predicted nucleic-acid-binding Zn-ribbon protein
MGGRYLVTGAQLGMLAGFAKTEACGEIEKEVHSIVDSNYIGDSIFDLEDDIKSLDNIFDLEEAGILEEEYEEEKRFCPKCGNTDLSLKYVEAGEKKYRTDVSDFIKEEPIWETSTTKQFYILNRNVLVVHCRQCQFEWWEKPLDE